MECMSSIQDRSLSPLGPITTQDSGEQIGLIIVFAEFSNEM